MAASLPIPIYDSLDQIYPDTNVALIQSSRWNALTDQFEKHFGKKPSFVARAPGRVNLIGEHIDYALFGVIPAAVERDILIAVSLRETDDPGRVTAENMDSKYTRQTFAPFKEGIKEWHLDIDKTQLRWESYVKAGYYGVLSKYFSGTSDEPKALDLLVTGSVPAGSGLSSSAAMVVASTLGFLAINGKIEVVTKGELVELAVKNERRVGVNSGGMDQSASVISSADSAIYVSFYPQLAAEPIPLPITSPRSVFVCANSLVVSDKVVHSRTRYNLRVVETLVAARVLAHHLGINLDHGRKATLRELLDLWLGVEKGSELSVDKLKESLEQILEHVDVLKPKNSDGAELGVDMDEMIEMSALSTSEFHDLFLSWVDIEATKFQLYKRAKHVFEEALRVLEFRSICLHAAGSGGSPNILQDLGQLMDASHKSCAELFECSCPELDKLTQLAKEAGAYGSRLTGAGWGGCTVSLVEEARVPEFISKVKAGYPPYHGLDQESLQEVIFATKPSSGACLFRLS